MLAFFFFFKATLQIVKIIKTENMVIRNSHVNPQKNSILQEFRITITRLWDKCERSLFRSADPTSLAVFRISFGSTISK